MITEVEKRIIASIQGDIPVTQRPYLEISKKIGITEEELLIILENLVKRGVIRRFGATLRHQKSGFTANAMVAWQVDRERINEVGKIMAGFKEVSHCYQRNPAEGWPYNLYTMIHASNEESCKEIACQMSEKTSVKNYSLLFSRRELKKTSMKYFAT
jgi:DNA-binding Lrp family transcriptional regulator